ncbi:MAG: response regulator [Eubacteriales bacterium]
MYKILLADDEAIVTDSVKYIIEHNIEETCEIQIAKTGRSVIELAESFQPDFIFMDIQMPGINGIDAMKEIRKNNRNVLFVVMTAYDKFDYAKEAVNLGVLEYLTKPVNQRKIVEVIYKAMDIVGARREKRSQDLQIKEKLEIVVPIIEQGFISAGMYSGENINEMNNYKNLLGIEEDHFFTLVLEFGENLLNVESVNPVGTGVRLQRNYEHISNLIKTSYTCFLGPVLGNRINCVVPTAMEQGDYESRALDVERCRELVRYIEKHEELHCRIGIGSIVTLERMGTSFQDAWNALRNGKGKVVHCRDLPIFCEYEDDYPIELEHRMFERIKAGQVAEARRLAEEFYEWMLHKLPEYEQSARLKALEFVIFADNEAYKSGGLLYRFGDRKDYLSVVMAAKLEDELRNWFLDKITAATENIATKKKVYTHEAVQQAKEYIQIHYKKDISLEGISREMDMSPYYFSKLFKEVTGENFIEYVTSIRINKAKELLLEGKVTMKEICLEIGYSDPNYFSRIFKKSVGKTPTEFKEGNA